LKTIRFILLLCLSLPTWAINESVIDISIVKSKDGRWTLTYQAHKPASRLSFVRNPDYSRIERWQPKTSDFEIVSIENQEYLIKKDGSSFTEVSLNLTPTYKHLSKGYAPFSPYSDGGALIYTGRLFACINTCLDEVNQWQFSMQVPEGEHIIVDGKVLKEVASWTDRNDGKNIYVGSQQPIETENVIALVDSGLPEKIKHSLNSDIPTLMNYFEQRLGKLEGVKPTLFASYANVDGHASQGGTLPNQIFMHWDLNNLNEKIKDNKFLNDTIWFFAHEVAHLYQTSSKVDIYGERYESWLHEGHADWLAALALLKLYPETSDYVTHKINRSEAHCSTGLSDFPLIEAANEGRFDLYYTCGLLIHKAIDLTLQKNGDRDIYSLWVDFRKQAEKDNRKRSEIFLLSTEKWASKKFVNKIREIIEKKLSNPEESLNQIATGG